MSCLMETMHQQLDQKAYEVTAFRQSSFCKTSNEKLRIHRKLEAGRQMLKFLNQQYQILRALQDTQLQSLSQSPLSGNSPDPRAASASHVVPPHLMSSRGNNGRLLAPQSTQYARQYHAHHTEQPQSGNAHWNSTSNSKNCNNVQSFQSDTTHWNSKNCNDVQSFQNEMPRDQMNETPVEFYDMYIEETKMNRNPDGASRKMKLLLPRRLGKRGKWGSPVKVRGNNAFNRKAGLSHVQHPVAKNTTTAAKVAGRKKKNSINTMHTTTTTAGWPRNSLLSYAAAEKKERSLNKKRGTISMTTKTGVPNNMAATSVNLDGLPSAGKVADAQKPYPPTGRTSPLLRQTAPTWEEGVKVEAAGTDNVAAATPAKTGEATPAAPSKKSKKKKKVVIAYNASRCRSGAELHADLRRRLRAILGF